MRILLSLIAYLLISSCFQEADPYPWFQGQWISDAALTMANNPQYDRLEVEDYARVSAEYGKVHWAINGTTMVYYDTRTDFSSETEFFVKAIDEDSFNYSDEWGGHLRLWKSRTGFCMQTISLLDLETITECFRPFVAESSR